MMLEYLGALLCHRKKFTIGKGVLIGANSTIIDTNFHPTNGEDIRYSQLGVKSKEIIIDNNIFIGMFTMVLKRARIKNDNVVLRVE